MGLELAKKQKIRLPMILFCLYILAVPLTIIPIPGGISLLKLVTIFDVAIMIPLIFIGDNEVKPNIVHFVWMLYMIYSISSMFWLRDESAIETFRGLAEVTALAMLVTIRVYNQREKRLLNNVWLIVGVIMICLMLFSSNVMQNGGGRETITLFGVNEDPNQLCGYFILPVVVCMERVVESSENSKLRLMYIVFLLLVMYVVFMTGSRGGLIAILGTVVVYTFISVRGIRGKIVTVAALAFMFIVFVVFIAPLLPDEIMARFDINTVIEDRASNRFDIWLTLFNDLIENINSFVFGKGFISTATALNSAGITNTVAHNHIIQVYYDQGLLGGTIFIVLLVVACIRTLKTNKTVTVALIGMIVLGMGLTMYPYYKPFWNILIMSALNFTEKEEENAKD